MITVPYEIAKRVTLDNVHPVTAWRQYYGLTKAVLARRLQIHEEELTKIESSNLHLHPANLSKLSQVFGILPSALDVRYQSFPSSETFSHAKN